MLTFVSHMPLAQHTHAALIIQTLRTNLAPLCQPPSYLREL
jgi:hypothetical protein